MPELISDPVDRTGQRGQMGDPDIDTNRATHTLQRLFDRPGCNRVADKKRDLPTATGVTDRHLLDRRPTVLDNPEQTTSRLDRVQPDQLLHHSPDVSVLRVQQRLGEHQPDPMP